MKYKNEILNGAFGYKTNSPTFATNLDGGNFKRLRAVSNQ